MKKIGMILGALAAGVGAMLVFGKSSHAAQSGLPTGWTPPSGAAFLQIPPSANNPTGLTLNCWRWPDPGNTGGQQLLVTNAANQKTDFAAFFVAANGTKSPLVVGTTPNSGLIAQAVVAGLVK